MYADGTWLTPYCEDLFGSFLRSDQRRWGEVYVQGLVSVPGRKSIRRISDHVVGRPVDQCLQQFVNQSPWDWGPVRQRLAQLLVQAIRPKAWVLEEVVFPKNGSKSVGVERQFVNSAGRVINCQLGLAVVLVGEDGGCPVNWRLMLPRSWDDDDGLRSRTRVPTQERCRPRWRHLLDAIDEMVIDWGLPPAPIVVDARSTPGVEHLIAGLAERGLPYLVRVAQNALPAMAPGLPARPLLEPIRPRLYALQGRGLRPAMRGPYGPGTPRPHDAAARGAGRPGLPHTPEHGPARPTRAPERHAADGRHDGAARSREHWQPGAVRTGTRPIWLTDLGRNRVPDLAGLVGLRNRALAELGAAGESGLQHFEGRSFQGWHHHVTLVSVAHAYRLLRRLEGESAEDLCLCPHG
ncbi:IS701 family transposase [Nonomuraea sp. NPDC050536]|uniref:IS701 family transposase n=1 Tax=Nonomuraea sp. NPDC050536 TaxID=3364366 RepID=UPI0037C65111